ncbi:MAG TPA: hypothetical protein VFQ40_03830, partial [Actinomycetota bacterium]|nr:hypothetical protein [Actinomycetota bacterium]
RREHGLFAAGSYRDPTHDVGVGEDFVAVTDERWPMGDYLGKTTLRHVYVRYRQWAAGSAPLLSVTSTIDGVDGPTDTIGGKAAPGTYVERVDLGGTGRAFSLKFTSSPSSAQNPAYSIEKVTGIANVGPGVR